MRFNLNNSYRVPRKGFSKKIFRGIIGDKNKIFSLMSGYLMQEKGYS